MVSLFKKSTAFLTSQQASIMSAAFVITSLVFVSAALGFVRQRFLLSTFYTPSGRQLADAYLVAFRIPDFLYQLLVAGVLSATFIPVYTRVHNSDLEEGKKLVNSLVTQLSVVYVIFAIIVGYFSPEIIRAMTGPKFTLDQVLVAANMTRLMLLSTFFLLLSNFLSGILQSNKHFLLPALSPVLYNLGIIFGIVFLSKPLGIFGPAVGVVIGAFAHLLIQIPLSRRFGLLYKPEFSLRNVNVREVYRLMIPRGATLTTNYIEDFVGLYIATSIGNTLVTIYSSAQLLAAAPIRFFGVSIAQAALPFLTIKAKENDIEGFMQLLTKTLHQIAFFMFPAGALLLILRIPIVRLVFGAKNLPWSDTVLMGRLVALYSLSIAALAMTHVVLRAYYALKETRLPFVFAVLSMSVNICIMYFGAFYGGLGILSVALGPTVAAVLEFVLLLVFLFRKQGYFSPSEFFYPQGKLVLATFCMAVSLYVPMKLLDQLVFDTTRVLGLLALTGITSIIGVIVYIGFCALFRVEQLSIVASIHGRIRESLSRLSGTQEVITIQEDVS